MTEVKTTFGGFPDPMADKRTKDSREYILAYAKAMYGQFGRYGLRVFYNDRIKYRNLANYALGLQPLDKYKRRMDVWNEDEPGKDTFINIDWQILNLATKFVNIMSNKITDAGYDVECHPIDPLALDARKNIEYKMKAVMEHREWFSQMGLELNPEKLGFDPAMLPDHSDELEIHMNMTYKDRFAMEAEMAIKLHMTNNDFEQVRKEIVRDSVIYGVMSAETRNDKNGNTKIKRIPPESVIIGNSISEDFKNVTHGGYIENITFSELQVSAGKQFTQDQYEEIKNGYYAPKSANQYLFMGASNIASDGIQEQMISVMKFYYKTSVTSTYIKKKDKRGNDRLYPQGPNTQAKEGQELIRDTYEVVYEGMWIVNSNFIYNYGMMNDMEVDPLNPCATRIPLHVICPNMLNGNTISILHSCIPILDQIQLNWLQFQHMVAQVVPDGHAIDLDALIEAPLGKGGKNFTPRQVLDMYFKKGILAYSGKGQANRGGNGVPVQPMENGNYAKAFGFLNNVFALINLLRQVSGMNEGVDASTPSPDALVGTLQIAAQGADQALGYLYKADRLMVKHIAESCIRLTQNAVRNGEVSGYIDSIGISSVNFWKVSTDITAHQYGMQIVAQPTQAEWMEFYRDLADAVKTGVVSLSDKIVMQEMTNLKQARQYMAMIERRRKKEAMEMQQMTMQQQAQLNQESMAATEQMKQQTIQLETQSKLAIVQAEEAKELRVLDKKYGYDLELKRMELDQKDDAAQLQARTTIVDTTLKSQAQIDKQNHDREEREIKEEKKEKEKTAA